ncbi:MAG: MFS transporter [Proteobacteria bacterium]|nr:MFS transporter [Pseudomonadota bacterium]
MADGPRSESDYEAEVEAHLRRNYLAHLGHGLLGQTGFRLVNAPTFIPAYLHALSGAEWVVGLARGLQYLGMFLSPIFSAATIEHRRRVLPVGFAVGLMMRLMVLGVALSGLLLPDPWRVWGVIAFLGSFGFFLGMQAVVFSYLMSKVIPVRVRGRLLGLRNTLAGLTAVGVSWIGGEYLVERNVLGDGYAATFLAAFVLTSLGLSLLLFVREPEPPTVRSVSPFGERLRELPGLLRSDRAFTIYFAARGLATMGRMSVPFLILYVGAALGGLSGTTLAILTAVFTLANTLANLPWGGLADRVGFRNVFVAALATWAGATVGLLWAEGLFGFALVFLGVGAGQAGFQLSAQNLVLEFGERDDLPMRIAVANSTSELFAAVGVIAGGLLAHQFSMSLVFAVSVTCQLAAIAVVLRYVDEPRRRVGQG